MLREGPHVPRVAPHQDRERREGVLLGPEVRANAGPHPLADAGGPGEQPAEPRRDRTDPQTIQVFSLSLRFLLI